MEEFQILRSFIENSDFTPEIKAALYQTVILAYENRPVSAYGNLVKELAEGHQIEN
jgi:hypothetical protein